MNKITQRLIASSALLAGFVILSPVYKSLLKFNPCSQKYARSVSPPLLEEEGSVTVFEQDRDVSSLGTPNRDNFALGTAISPNGKEVYRLTDRGIQMTDYQTGEQIDFDIPYYLPKLSWGMDIAYDTKRDLVTLVSLGGEGYLYRFDVKQGLWLDARSLDNIDVQSITYNRASDLYTTEIQNYGMESNGSQLFISGTGELLLDRF